LGHPHEFRKSNFSIYYGLIFGFAPILISLRSYGWMPPLM
jgi:hypothetical protein